MPQKLTDSLFEQNKEWAALSVQNEPEFFSSLEKIQKPEFLWIGCSDSRVPANVIVGLKPGEMFVHRNIANVVPHGDVNSHSVIQYAVEVLGVSHIIVTGHYGCGGVKAAMDSCDHGAIDNWLANIKDTYQQNFDELKQIDDPEKRADRLVELNVRQQVRNVAKTSAVQSAWRDGKKLTIHGWVYALSDGILHDLDCDIDAVDQLHTAFQITQD